MTERDEDFQKKYDADCATFVDTMHTDLRQFIAAGEVPAECDDASTLLGGCWMRLFDEVLVRNPEGVALPDVMQAVDNLLAYIERTVQPTRQAEDTPPAPSIN